MWAATGIRVLRIIDLLIGFAIERHGGRSRHETSI
jgi:hypothetical protein